MARRKPKPKTETALADVLAQSTEGQATLDAFMNLQVAMTNLDTIIAAAEAGGGAWDSATASQRTSTIRIMAKAIRAMAYLMQGCTVPPGTARVPD